MPDDEDELEEELEEEEVERRLAAAGGERSASGSAPVDRVPGMVLRAAGGANGRAPLGRSSGGGSSTCMCWALLCSTGVGAAPKSTYREPGILFWISLSSVNMS